jgi:hypothetical protein
MDVAGGGGICITVAPVFRSTTAREDVSLSWLAFQYIPNVKTAAAAATMALNLKTAERRLDITIVGGLATALSDSLARSFSNLARKSSSSWVWRRACSRSRASMARSAAGSFGGREEVFMMRKGGGMGLV